MRLIDADKLRNGWLYNGANENIYCANDVIDDIDEQPTVDAIEVVRCKNCENRNNQIENKFYGFCVIQEHFTGDDDYCIYGKRIGGGLEDKPAIEVKNAFVAVPNGNKKSGGSKMIEVEILPNHTKEYMKGYCDAMDKVKSNDFIEVTSSMREPTNEENIAYQQMIEKKSKKIGVNVFNMINNNTTDFMKTHNQSIGDLIDDLLRDMECELENIRDMVHDNTISNEDVIDYIDEVIDIIR